MRGSPGDVSEEPVTYEKGKKLENELWRRWSNRRVGESAVTYVKRRKAWRMSCDLGEVTEGLENELRRRWSDGRARECANSPTLPSLYLRHSLFSNHSVTSRTPQLILQPFFRFTYVTAHSPTIPSLYLRHSSFSNPSFASPMSQALHLRHLAFRPWY